MDARPFIAAGAAFAISAGIVAVVASPDETAPAAQFQPLYIDGGIDRSTMTDLLTEPVQPGATVTTEVNVALGKRVDMAVLYVGEAVGRFETMSLEHIDHDPPSFRLPDGGIDTRPGATTIRLTARNTSGTATRLRAFVHLTGGH